VTALTTAAAVATVILATWQIPTADREIHGLAKYYDRGVMEIVAVNRGRIADESEYDTWLKSQGLAGAVALSRNADRGRRVWITNPRTGEIEGPFLSIDCSNRAHYRQRIAAGTIVDVDYQTAKRWNMAGPLTVTVWFADPAEEEF